MSHCNQNQLEPVPSFCLMATLIQPSVIRTRVERKAIRFWVVYCIRALVECLDVLVLNLRPGTGPQSPCGRPPGVIWPVRGNRKEKSHKSALQRLPFHSPCSQASHWGQHIPFTHAYVYKRAAQQQQAGAD